MAETELIGAEERRGSRDHSPLPGLCALVAGTRLAYQVLIVELSTVEGNDGDQQASAC
jgi:hypothetical protein